MKLFTIFLFTAVLFTNSAFAQDMDEQTQSEYKENLFAAAEKKILVGKYEDAIKIYDTMLENVRPIDHRIFEMKGIALSSLRLESTLAMQPQQNITVRDPTNLNDLDQITISGWVLFDESGSADLIIEKHTSTSGGYERGPQ